ncbi:MAG: tetratricopeptide repeat protein [Nitrospirae bacterium]|jgi:tetratricopeptide (TPR) repeat protein|nr:tetratricopeptide repeat protein [Nitrospirota bacterium]
MNTRPILDNMNLPLLGMSLAAILVAFVFAAVGTAYVLRRARGTIQEPKIRLWAKIGWAVFAVYVVGYMTYFYKKAEPVVIAYPFTAGDRALASGHYKEALDDYKAVVARYPNFGMAHYKLGMLYRVVKQVDGSIAELKKAIALDPNLAPAYFALGSILWTRGTAMDAMPYFEKGLTLDPKTPQRPFFQQIIDRAKKEKAGLIKPGTSGRPHLSPASPAAASSSIPPSGANTP